MEQKQLKYDPMSDLDKMSTFEMNPQWYAHLCINQIIRAPQLAFMNGADKAALMSIAYGVEQLESICISNNMLKNREDYEMFVKDRKEKIEGFDKLDKLVQNAKVANIKFEYLMRLVFEKSISDVEIVV